MGISIDTGSNWGGYTPSEFKADVSSLANNVKESFSDGIQSAKEKYNTAVTTVVDIKEDIETKFENGFKTVSNAFTTAASTLKDQTSNFVSGTKTLLGEVKTALGEFGNWAEGAGEKVAEFSKDAYEWVTTKENWEKVGAKIESGVQFVGEKIDAAVEWVTTKENWEKIGAKIESGVTTAVEWAKDPENWKKVWKWVTTKENWEKVGATVATTVASVLTGIGDLGEKIVDGVTWCGAKITEGVTFVAAKVLDAYGHGEAAENVMNWREKMKTDVADFIATDHVKDVEAKFFENTEIGQKINDASYLKYDSKVAQGISSVTEKVAEFAAATAITVATGGAGVGSFAAVFGAGFLAGVGGSAEKNYSEIKEAGGQPSLDDKAANILFDGIGSGLSWYAQGQMGKGAVEAMQAVSQVGGTAFKNQMLNGIKEGFANFKSMSAKERAAAMFSKGNFLSIDNLADSGGVVADNVAAWINGDKELNWKTLLGAGVELFGTMGLNCITGGIMGQVDKADDVIDGVKEIDDAVDTAKHVDDVVDASKHMDDVADATKKLKNLTDDEAISYANKILNSDSPTTITGLNELDEKSIKKVVDCMTPEEIAVKLEKVSKEDYYQLMKKIPKEDKLEIIYSQARLAAQGKYDAFFMNFREHAKLHTDEVRDYAVALARSSAADINIDEVFYGAQFHDLGMKGGVYADLDGVYRQVDSLGKTEVTLQEVDKYVSKNLKKALGEEPTAKQISDYMRQNYGISDWQKSKVLSEVPEDLQEAVYLKRVKDYIEDNLPSDIIAKYKNVKSIAEIPDDIIDASYRYTTANLVRANHPLNSAVIVLTEDMVPDGVDPDIVALLAMSHSKSTSGIKDLGDVEQWKICINRLEKALSDSGVSATQASEIADRLRDIISDGNNPRFKQLVNEALCIRDGDALSKVPLLDGDTIMQNGTRAHVTWTGKAKLSDDYSEIPTALGLDGDELRVARAKAQKLENEGIIDEIFDVNGNSKGSVENAFSKKIHAGELNVKFDSDYDGIDYIATAVIDDPTKAPIATVDAVFERTGEVATYGNCNDRVFEIQLPKEMEDTDLGKWYVEEIAARAMDEAKKRGADQAADFYINSIKVVFN